MERGKRSTEEYDQTALAVVLLKLHMSKTTKFESFVIDHEQINVVFTVLRSSAQYQNF